MIPQLLVMVEPKFNNSLLNYCLKINFNDGSKPSLLFLVFSRKANRIIGALAPNTRVKTFARAERSVSVPQTDPELFLGEQQ